MGNVGMKNFARLSLSVVAIATLAAPARAANEQASVAVAGVNLLFLSQYVAADQHLWEKRGLDVKVLNIVGIGAMNALISGSVNFSMSSGAAITRAVARGQKLVALATAINQTGQSIIIRKDVAEAGHFDPNAPLSVRAQFLKGRTIAHGATAGVPDVVLKAVGKAGGVAPDQMLATPMQPPEFMAAFAAKKIDGFSNSPPFVEQTLIEGTGVLLSDTRKGEPTEFSPVSSAVLMTKADYCAKDKSICDKMVKGLVDALVFIREQPDATVAVMKAHFGAYDDKVLRAAYETVRALTAVPPVTTPKMLENSDSLNVAAGFLKAEEKLPHYDDLIDNSFQ